MRALFFIPCIFLAPPAWSSSSGDAFTALFASTCMKHFYSHDQLRAEMAALNAPVLAGDQAAFFLGGVHGTAWTVLQAGQRYVVALRDDGICAAYAQHADVPEVQADFTGLVSSSPAPLVAERLDGALSGPDRGALHTIAYAWSRPNDKTQLTFTLTTSTEGVPVQAMASVSVGAKPNPSSKRTR
jgi:hypothetical protein